MKRYYYIISLLFVFVLPMLVEAYFVADKIFTWDLVAFVTGITILGSIWDIWATRHGKRDPIWLWQFNFRDTIGIKLFDLPIEEYLFYIASSLYIVFTWEGIKYASSTGNPFAYLLLSGLGTWTLIAILVPYKMRVKNDKL